MIISYCFGSPEKRLASTETKSVLGFRKGARRRSIQAMSMENRPRKSKAQIPFNDRSSITAMTFASPVTRCAARTFSRHAFLLPSLRTKQRSHGWAESRCFTAAVTVLSIWTNTMARKTTFTMMMRTIAVPRHCRAMTFLILR